MNYTFLYQNLVQNPKPDKRCRYLTWERAGVRRLLAMQCTVNSLLIRWDNTFRIYKEGGARRDTVSIQSRKQQKAPRLQKKPCASLNKSPEGGIQRANTLSDRALLLSLVTIQKFTLCPLKASLVRAQQ